MLDHLIETRQDSKTNRRPISLKATVLLHVVILGSIWFYGWIRVPAIPEPPLQVTFAQIAPPPPPPPPPPPAAKAPQPKPEPVMPKPEDIVEPEKVPEVIPPSNPDSAASSGSSNATGGMEGGVLGGVAGGVPGGVPGSVSDDTGPLHIGGDVLAPSIESRVDPAYPPAARNARLQGVVVLEVVVRKDGSVDPSNIKVIKSLGMGLTQSAQNAVKQWRFNPATRHGLPVDVIDRIEVSFIIR
jgi:periplasmic protein TonB